jgi:hypothetical protein
MWQRSGRHRAVRLAAWLLAAAPLLRLAHASHGLSSSSSQPAAASSHDASIACIAAPRHQPAAISQPASQPWLRWLLASIGRRQAAAASSRQAAVSAASWL